jgi:hypothetical protein
MCVCLIPFVPCDCFCKYSSYSSTYLIFCCSTVGAADGFAVAVDDAAVDAALVGGTAGVDGVGVVVGGAVEEEEGDGEEVDVLERGAEEEEEEEEEEVPLSDSSDSNSASHLRSQVLKVELDGSNCCPFSKAALAVSNSSNANRAMLVQISVQFYSQQYPLRKKPFELFGRS